VCYSCTDGRKKIIGNSKSLQVPGLMDNDDLQALMDNDDLQALMDNAARGAGSSLVYPSSHCRT